MSEPDFRSLLRVGAHVKISRETDLDFRERRFDHRNGR